MVPEQTTFGVKWGVDLARAPAPVRASSEPIIRFFSYHDAHPVALATVLLKQFGHEWLTWEPETLRHEIVETFHATSVSDQNWQKIQAVRTLMLTIGCWHDWPIFEKVVQALSNNMPRVDIVQRPTIGQLWAGVDMIGVLRREPFADEIARYVAACAVDQGVTYLPPPLDFARQALAVVHYYCDDCDNVAEDENEDGRCDNCVGRWRAGLPLSQQHIKELPAELGRRLRRAPLRDPEPARRRFEELRLVESAELDPENAEDVQAAKLVVAERYARLRNEQLVAQLEELRSWIG